MTDTQKHLTGALSELRKAMAAHPGANALDDVARSILEAFEAARTALRKTGIETKAPRSVKCGICGGGILALGLRGRDRSVHEDCRRAAEKVREVAS